MVSTRKTTEYNFSFTINGDVTIRTEYYISGSKKPINEDIFYPKIIWVSSDKLISFLKEKRRKNLLPRDCCIYKNMNNFSVQYFDDNLLKSHLIKWEQSFQRIKHHCRIFERRPQLNVKCPS